jgi:hypothetical protein
MLPYSTAGEAEAALGRALTWAEAAWLRYSASVPDCYLHWPNIAITLVVYTLAPLPLVLLDLAAPEIAAPYKLQPKVQHPPAAFFRCYMDAVRVSLLTIGPYQLISYPAAKVYYTSCILNSVILEKLGSSHKKKRFLNTVGKQFLISFHMNKKSIKM